MRFTDATPFDQIELDAFRVDHMSDEEVQAELRDMGVDPKEALRRTRETLRRALEKHRQRPSK